MMLSKKNIKKIIFGGVYTITDEEASKYCKCYMNRLNDQKYGWWIPTHSRYKDEDKYFMIDTYEIDRYLFDNPYTYDKEEYMQQLVAGLKSTQDPDNKGNYVAKMPYNYYYANIIQVTDENIDKFKLACNLEDYRLSDTDDCRYYNDDDVIKYLKLYNEHYYPDGIMVVKKDAKYNYDKFLNAKMDDILKYIQRPNYCNDYYIKDVIEIEKDAIKNNANYNKQKLDKILAYNEFMKKLRDLSDTYIKNI